MVVVGAEVGPELSASTSTARRARGDRARPSPTSTLALISFSLLFERPVTYQVLSFSLYLEKGNIDNRWAETSLAEHEQQRHRDIHRSDCLMRA